MKKKEECEHEYSHCNTKNTEFVKFISVPKPCCWQCWKCSKIIPCTEHQEKGNV